MKKHFILVQMSIFFCVAITAQNVGVGTSTPSEKLHVAGNIKADTVKPNAIKLAANAGTGKILTSDAAGNANWQASNSAAAAGNVGFGVWGDCATNGNISEYYPVADATGYFGNQFGASVSISGNFAIIGTSQDSVNGAPNQGSASIYQYISAGWVFMQKLTDATGAAEDAFGNCVSISGNYAIVGATKDDVSAHSNQGSASIFHYNGSSWVLQQQIIDPMGEAGDNFGYSVSVSGNYAVVGAPLDDGENTDEGSVLVYHLNGSTWELQQKITIPGLNDGDNFGHAVSISGDRLIAGAPFVDSGDPDIGSAWIYHYNGSAWVEQTFSRGSNAYFNANNQFGYSVSLSGEYAVVGSPFAGGNEEGYVFVYKYNGNKWNFLQIFSPQFEVGTTGDDNGNFGESVSISGNYFIVGMPGYQITNVGSGVGASVIYQKVGGAWQTLQFILDPGKYPGTKFGSTVQIDGATKRFLIASPINAGGGKVSFGKVN